MPLKIVRNDITRMQCDAIVNTAGSRPAVGAGCDHAVYTAAGYDELLEYRKEKIGHVEEGKVFITPAFRLQAKYIIHAVSPLFVDGSSGEEEKLRSCYRKSLALARSNHVQSIAFPLISTGSFGYPLEEGMRIAIDEISSFLLKYPMLVWLVVFDSRAVKLGENICPDLESYIDQNYVSEKEDEEYGGFHAGEASGIFGSTGKMPAAVAAQAYEDAGFEFDEHHESKLNERMKHLSDTFSEYLMYLIKEKGMSSAEVYKRAIVDRKVFSKIRNNPDYHPQKLTALCLCIGAQLNMDETKDLLARAGYALSPCDKTDVIFSYFIENGIYDMIELDIQLEAHDLKYLIS